MNPPPPSARWPKLLMLFHLGLAMAVSHFAISLQLTVGITHHSTETQTILMFLYPLAYTFVGVGALVEESFLRRSGPLGSETLPLRLAGGVLLLFLGVVLRFGLMTSGAVSLATHAAFDLACLAGWFLLLGVALSQLLARVKTWGSGWIAGGWAVHLAGLLVGYLANHTLTLHVGASAVLLSIGLSLLLLPRFAGPALVLLLALSTVTDTDRRIETLRDTSVLVTQPGFRVRQAVPADASGRSPPSVRPLTAPVHRSWSPYSLFALARMPTSKGGTDAGYMGYYNFRRVWSISKPPELDGVRLLRQAVYSVIDPEDRAVFIGVGGGSGLTALPFEPHSGIVAVERDPAVVRLFRDLEPDLNGGLYRQVRAIAADGRYVLEAREDPLDVVVVESAVFQPPRALMSLTAPTWLYTTESLTMMLDTVGPDGLLLLHIARTGPSQRKARGGPLVMKSKPRRQRLREHIMEVLARLGATRSEIELQVGMPGRGRGVSTYVLASPDPRAHQQALARIEEATLQLGDQYRGALVPLRTDQAMHRRLRWMTNPGLRIAVLPAESPSETSVPEEELIDDRPFLGWLHLELEGRHSILRVGVGICLAGLLLTLPLFLRRRPPGSWNPVPYFFLLGVGHTAIQMASFYFYRSFFGDEITTMSRLIVYFLLFGAIGSLLSRPLAMRPPRRSLAIALVVVCLAVHVAGLKAVPFLSSNTPLRELYVLLTVLPGGILMGVFFPLGLARCEPELVGRCLLADALGVVAAYGLVVVVALPLGLTAFLAVPVAAYILAATLGWGPGRQWTYQTR